MLDFWVITVQFLVWVIGLSFLLLLIRLIQLEAITPLVLHDQIGRQLRVMGVDVYSLRLPPEYSSVPDHSRAFHVFSE